MAQDYYEILQVHPKADQEAIEAAYTRLLGRYDPARLEGAAEELVLLARQKREAIEAAYATLGDPARRARYDAERLDEPEPDPDDAPSLAGGELDYRPLPPARGQERGRGFNSQPAQRSTPRSAGRSVGRSSTPPWAAPVGITGLLLALVVGASMAITGGSAPAAAPPTATPLAIAPTPAPLDQWEEVIPQARQAAEQSPKNAQAWIDYGNFLYDSVQAVREAQPDSPLYQQRVPRWLEASKAYRKALEIEPNNWLVRADLGASSCFYGSGTNDQKLVAEGLVEARKAKDQQPNDPRVLLSLGHCLVSSQPPLAAEAVTEWQRVIEIAPDSPLATQARQLIARYNQK